MPKTKTKRRYHMIKSRITTPQVKTSIERVTCPRRLRVHERQRFVPIEFIPSYMFYDFCVTEMSVSPPQFNGLGKSELDSGEPATVRTDSDSDSGRISLCRREDLGEGGRTRPRIRPGVVCHASVRCRSLGQTLRDCSSLVL